MPSFPNMISGPNHSIKETLLLIATLVGFFSHMKGKANQTPMFTLFYFIVILCIPALLITYKTW